MAQEVSVQLAQTQEEYEQALSLMHGGRKELGVAGTPECEEGLWLTKHHALPSTNTIVAKKEGRVIGAITLFGESAFRLPLEEQADLSRFRQGLAGRVGEFSLPGLHADYQECPNILLALYHYALCFGSTYCHYEAFVTQVPERWGAKFRELLRYEPLLLKEKVAGLTLFRSAREGADFRDSFRDGFQPRFQFPERKFFLVAHQSLQPEILNYLFNERTKLFARLEDIDIRVLKNYYDQGSYAFALPTRNLVLPFRRLPRFQRFPMNCEGHLCEGNGRRFSVQVLDVSREGLKIRCESRLDLQRAYPLTLQVGVRKQAEVIASTVWVDEEALIAGLAVKSGDENWHALLEYLSQYFLRVA